MKLADHFDTHPETGRAMLPPAEVFQEEHDLPPRWLAPLFVAVILFWTAVGVWVVW